MVEGEDFVVCKVCGKKLRSLIVGGHLSKKHGMTIEDYQNRFPDTIITCSEHYKQQSEVTKKAFKDPKLRQNRSEIMKSKWKTGKLGNEHWRKVTSESRKKAWSDPNSVYNSKKYREVLSKNISNAQQRPEVKKKVSEGVKAAWERGVWDGIFTSEEYRKKQSEKSKHVRASTDAYDNMYTPEVRQKMSEGIKDAYKRPESRKRASDARRKAWREGVYDNVFLSPSKPELIAKELIDKLELPYKQQFRIVREDGKCYFADFLVGDTLVLEVFGDYWHGPDRPGQQGYDQDRLAWFEENGYDTLVLWENEVNNEPEYCMDIIRNHVKEFSIFK